jgi:ankyrin repeat protein
VKSAKIGGPIPLFTAASNGHVGVVRELLEHGAKVEISDKDGWTSLYTAASNGHLEVVREL